MPGYGGRNVVSAGLADGDPSSSAATADAMTPEVLPWSDAGPDRGVALDVLDRAKTRADRTMDVGDGRVPLEVDVQLVPRPIGGRDDEQRLERADGRLAGGDVGRGAVGDLRRDGRPALGEPASAAARTPAAMPWRIASPVENEPVTAPATSMGPAGSSGTKAPIASSQRVVPRTWLHRWIAGFQPPDTATRSHGIRATIPSAVRTATDTTRSSPVAAATSPPVWTGMRASRARATVSGRRLPGIHDRRDLHAGPRERPRSRDRRCRWS